MCADMHWHSRPTYADIDVTRGLKQTHEIPARYKSRLHDELCPVIGRPTVGAKLLLRSQISLTDHHHYICDTLALTHCGLVVPHGDRDLDQHRFRKWLVCYLSEPSHRQNQYGLNLNWTLGNQPRWHFNQNTIIFAQVKAFEYVVYVFEYVVYTKATILFRSQCVNTNPNDAVNLSRWVSTRKM